MSANADVPTGWKQIVQLIFTRPKAGVRVPTSQDGMYGAGYMQLGTAKGNGRCRSGSSYNPHFVQALPDIARTSISRHQARDKMHRHRHVDSYMAVVISGGYVEAGDHGRVRAEPGHCLMHGAYEAHYNQFSRRGATVLNIPLPSFGSPYGLIDDPDAIARLAEHDLRAAVELLRTGFRPIDAQMRDWPDMLAAGLSDGTISSLEAWAAAARIAPQSLSRGFRQAYGTSPKRFRLEQRTRRAIRELERWPASLAGLAVNHGFADQAHLSRAVVAMTGLPPHRLRSEARSRR